MISLKAVIAICLGATLCTAQTINISGTVKDSSGVGISGATIKLEEADILATSGADGSFTLTKDETHTQSNAIRNTAATNPMQVHNGKITFTLSENTNVVISIHDVGGRRIYNSNRTYSSGRHAIVVPLQATGIHIYKLNIGNESYSFKSTPFGTFSSERSAASGNSSALAKQATSGAAIDDVIAATKTGWLHYRCVMRNSDTSGVVITMLPNAGNVTDADGNVYQSVRIGNQVWTVENLRTTKYNDGTAILHVTDNMQWSKDTSGARCYYNNDSAANAATYGALYNWYAVTTGKLAPAGWHVPTDAEWDTLQNYLIANGYNWDGTTSGNKIGKAMAAQTDWNSYTTTGAVGNDLSKNNASGFSALPGGFRYGIGGFYGVGYLGFWWSATEYDASIAFYRDLNYYFEGLSRYYYGKLYGFSVRLLRD